MFVETMRTVLIECDFIANLDWIEQIERNMNTSRELNIGNVSIRLSDRAFCPVCQKLIKLVSFADAAAMFRTDEDDITGLAESLKLHRVHNRRGKIMICTDSLFRCFDDRQTRILNPDLLPAGMAKRKAE